MLQLTGAIVASLALLWFADGLERNALLAWASAIIAMLWLTGAVMQSRVRLHTALVLDAAIVAAAVAVIV